MTHRLAPLGARTCGYRGHGRAPDAEVTDPCLLCLDIAGALDDASARGARPPSWHLADAIFNAGAHPPACAVESRFSRECPGALSEGARRRASGPPSGSGWTTATST